MGRDRGDVGATPLAQWIKVGRRGSGKGEGEREYSGRWGEYSGRCRELHNG